MQKDERVASDLLRMTGGQNMWSGGGEKCYDELMSLQRVPR